MMENRTLISSVLCLFFLTTLICTASADEFYSQQIDKGDAIQINNYVIQLTSTTIGAEINPALDFYELKSDGTYDDLKDYTKAMVYVDGKKYDFEKESDKISVEITNATSTYIIADIFTSGFSIEYKAAVDGGVSKAKFTGEPDIVLTKEVDKTSVEIGDLIRVTIKAKNIGEGKAKQINIDRGLTSGFIFKEDLPITPQTDLDPNEEYTMFIYTIEATTGGTFTLNPAVATYYSSVSDDKYTKSSNTPAITVAEKPVETSELELTINQDKTKLKRDDTITFTVYVKNIKDVPASTIRIEPIIPKNLTYISGSDEISIINEKPVIQINTFGAKYEEEYEFTCKADEVGIESVTVKLTYNDGVNETSKEMKSDMFIIEKGKYDFLSEFPLYVYITPIVIILAIVGWVLFRSRQFRM